MVQVLLLGLSLTGGDRMAQAISSICCILIYFITIYTRPTFTVGSEIFLIIFVLFINIRWAYLKIKEVLK